MPILRIRTQRTLTVAVALAVLLLVSGTVLTNSLVPQIPTGIWAPAGNGLNLSSPRAGAAAVQLDDGRILISGGNDGSGAVAGADIFDTSGNYSAAASMNVPRSQHTATLLADGTVLVAGGVGSDGNATSSAEIYNPSNNTWIATGSLVTPRSGATATMLPDGTVLVSGGDSSGTALSSLEIYDPIAGTFTAVAGALSSPREKHAAAALPNGDVLIAGGSDGSAALATTDVYSFSSGSIAPGPKMSTARAGLSATPQLEGDVLIAGGNDGTQDLASAEVYSASAGTFAATGSLGTPRQGHQAILLPHSGAILIVGGTATVSGTETATSSTEIYYPLASGTEANPNWNGTFNATGAMASPRVAATGSPMANGTPTSVNDGIVFVSGGKDSTGSALATGELYGFAWIKTDATDYAPGTTVNITGGGWQPGETVTLHLQELPYFDSHADLTAIADSNGKISNSQFAPDEHDVDIRFYLTATGSASGSQAQTTFTDNKNLVITFAGTGTGSVSVSDKTTPGDSTTCTGTCSVTTGNADAGTLTATANPGSSFAGWSAQSSGVTSCAGPTCNFSMGNSGQAVTATFNLHKLAITSVNGGANPTAGTPFSVVVQAQDGGGNPINVAANTSVTLTLNTGTGTLGGTLSGTISAGTNSVTISGVTYTKAESGVILTASRTSGDTIASGTSAAFTVNPGAVSAATSTVSANPTSIVANGTSTSTVTVTLLDADSNPVSGKTVSLTAGGGSSTITPVNGTTNSSGQATFTVKDTVVESVTYTAKDTADNIPANQTATVSFTPGAVSATASTVTANPASVTADGSTTSTITVTLFDGSSHPVSGKAVTLSQGTAHSNISPASGLSNASGVVTFTATDTTAEIVTYTAKDATDSTNINQAPQVSFKAGAASKLVFNQQPSTTTAGNAIAPAVKVQVEDANGNVVTTDSSTVAIAISAGGAFSGTSTLSAAAAAGVATFSNLVPTAAGTFTLTVNDGSLTAATSNSFTVDAGALAKFVFSPIGAQTVGAPFSVTITAEDANGNTITSFNGGGNNVTLTSTGNLVGAPLTTPAFTNGVLVQNVTITNAGSFTITATGNAGHGGGTGVSNAFTVNQASTSTLLSSSANPSTFGQSVTFTGTVTDSSPGSTGTPTGTVTFKDGSATLATSTLSAGVATFTTSALSISGSPHNFTAVYSGDPNFTGSTSNAVSQTIKQASSTTAISLSSNSILVGQSATVTATVSPQFTGTPTGTVTVSDGLGGAGDTCIVTLVAGTGTCNLTPSSNGSLTVTGNYSGDGNFAASSGSAPLTVTGTPPIITSAITAQFTAGTAGSFTITTTGIPTPTLTESTGTGQTGLPNGVTFTDNHDGTATISGTATVSGSYTFTITALNGVGSPAIEVFTLAVNPGAFTQLQILAPGETAAPGTATGNTGTPAIQYVNGAFNLTVNAVDQNFNVVNTITDAIAIGSNDAKAVLPASAVALVGGTGTFSVTPETESNPATTTFTASDTTTNSITPATTPTIEVITAYTAAITPTMAATGQATTYTVKISNGTAKDASNLASATVAVPAADQETITGVSINVTQQGGATANWTYDASQLPGSLRFSASTANDALAPGGTISITFTATSSAAVSSAPVQETWNTLAFTDSKWSNSLPLASAEPTVGIGVGPSFTSAASTAFTFGSAATFAVTTNGVPSNTLSESGLLPPGVTFTDNGDDTATIAGTPEKAGTYSFTITAHNGFGNDATQSFILTVNKANATINVVGYKVTYDASPHTATGTATGVGGVDLSSDLNLTGTTHTNAGTYSADSWSFTDLSGNYNSAGGTVVDEIDQATASITVSPYHVTYNAAPHAATGTATGVGGVDLGSDLNLTNTIHTNAGTYNGDFWTFTDLTGNYKNVGPTTITDQIDKANATIVVQGYSAVFDGNLHTASGTATGVKGEPLAGLDLSATAHTNAGTYNDVWTFTDGTGNYNNATGMVADVLLKATPVFGNLTPSQTIPFGEATVGVSGTLAAPSVAPPDGDLITISIAGTPVSQAASLASGAFTASLNSSMIPAATAPYTITYSFAGDANFNPASDVSTSLTVLRANTATTASVSSPTSTLGDTVTLTATVVDASGGSSGTPTGPVTFFDGTTPIGIGILSGGAPDQALFTTALLASGSHKITASYDSDTNFNASGSSSTGETVAVRGSSVAVSLNPSTVVVGQSSKVTVTVTDSGTNPPGAADAFTATGAPATGTSGATSTAFADGLVLVAGGLNSGGTAVQNAYLYNASTGTFTATGDLRAARTGATATLLPNGKILILGGSSDGTASGALNTAELYDPASGAFVAAGGGSANAMVASRFGHSATLLANGQVLIAGGENSGGALNSAELYNPATDSFTATGSLNAGRYGSASALLANGQVLVAGGTGAGSTVLASAELYDPAAGTFTATGNLGSARTGATATLLLNGSVLVAGGSSDGSTPLNTAELFDVSGGTFTASNSNLNTPRLNGTATLVPSGMVLLAGGAAAPTAELYDAESDRFVSTASLVQSDQSLVATLLNDGEVLAVGLTSGGSPVADAELYSPSFHPLGTVALSSSESTDGFNGTCVLAPGTGATSACDPTVIPANVATSPHTITGTFAADAVHSGSSNTASLVVNKADTSTSVISSLNPSTFGEQVTFTASVSVVAPGAGNPTGSVQFEDNNSPIGAPVPLSGGSAAFTTSGLQAGPHSISALYNGDSNFNGSSMTPPLPQTVNKATPAFSNLTASQSIAFGTKTISVSGHLTAPTAAPPDTDTVTISINATSVTVPLSGGAFSATLNTAMLPASATPYVITYNFGGDANFNSASDGSTSLTVNPAPTTITVISNLNPSTYGQTVTFTALVTNAAAGSPAVPTGSVSFTIDGTPVAGTLETCPSALPANRLCARLSTSALTVSGSAHSVIANFTNVDGNFVSSLGTLTNGQTVNPAPLTITATSGAMTYGNTPFVVMPMYNGFVNGEGPGNLNTPATCGPVFSVATTAGPYSTTCAGGVDSNYSIAYVNGNVVVQQAASTTSLVSSSTNNTSIYLQPVTFTATIAPQFSGLPSGSVTFYDAATGNSCAAPPTTNSAPFNVPVPVVSGAASITTTNLAGGAAPHTILACYSGDTNFVSSSGSVSQTVVPAPVVAVSPTLINFTGQNVGSTSAPMSVTLTNNGDADLNIAAISIPASTDSAEFTSSTNTANPCGTKLGYPGESGNPPTSCTVYVTFTPKDTGEAAATLAIIDNNDDVSGAEQDVTLTGGGLSTLATNGSLFTNAVVATSTSCGSITLSGGATIDSFNSAQSSSRQLSGGNVVTNGNVTLNGNATIYGAVAAVNSSTGTCKNAMTGLSTNGQAKVTGGLTALGGPISYPLPPAPNRTPPTTTQSISHACPSGMGGCSISGSKVTLAPGTYGNVQFGGGTNVALSAGTYNFNSLSMGGNSVLTVGASGPITINIAGAALTGNSPALDLSGGSIVNATGVPSNLEFFYGGSRTVNLSGGAQAYATVYAPAAPVSMTGGSDFFGAIVGLTVTSSGGTAIHYDRNLANVAGGYLWLTAVIHNVSGLKGGQAKLYLTNSTIQYTAGGSTQTVQVPNAVVTLNSVSATAPKTSYDLTNNRWITSVPAYALTGNTFVTGVAIPVPAGGFPAGIQNLSWSAAFSTDTPITFQWQWNAGVYSKLDSCYAYQNTNSAAACYSSTSNSNALNVNPEDGTADLNGTDPAGTPENYKQNEVIGFFSAPAGVAAAAAEMSVAPSNYAFPAPQLQGTTSAVTLVSVLTNNDGVTHAIKGFSVLGTYAADFALQSGGLNSCTGVTSLPAGASCNLYVTFTPSSAGAESARVVVNDDANNTPQTVFLAASGQ